MERRPSAWDAMTWPTHAHSANCSLETLLTSAKACEFGSWSGEYWCASTTFGRNACALALATSTAQRAARTSEYFSWSANEIAGRLGSASPSGSARGSAAASHGALPPRTQPYHSWRRCLGECGGARGCSRDSGRFSFQYSSEVRGSTSSLQAGLHHPSTWPSLPRQRR